MELFSRRPLAALSLALLLSSLTTLLINRSGISRLWALIPLLLFLLFAILHTLRKRKIGFFLLLLAAALLLGFLTEALYDDRHHRPWRECDGGARHSLTATVKDATVKGEETIYTLKVDKLNGAPVALALLLYTETADPPLPSHTRITCEVIVRETEIAYSYGDGIAGSATALSAPYVIGEAPREPQDALLTLRKTLAYRIRSGIDGEQAAFFSALLLGERTALPTTVTRNFQRAGIAHALALSGLHLSVLALLLLKLLHAVRVPRAVAFPILFLFMALYSAIAGFPLSLLRAALMLLISELSRLLRLFSDSITSLFFAVAVITVFSPTAVADIGLLLSFLATLGLLVVFEAIPHARTRRHPFFRLLRTLSLSLLSTFSAILFTALVTAAVFGKFSLLTPFSNLIVSPLISLSLLLGPFLLLFPTLLGPLCEAVGGACLTLVKHIASVRGSYVSVSYPLLLVALTLLFGLLLYLLIAKKRTPRALLLRLSPMLLLTVAVFLVCHVTTVQSNTLLYTEQSGNEYITLRTDGQVTVIDRGRTAYSVKMLEKDLEAAHITEIDTLILTRFDTGLASHIVALNETLTIRRLLLFPAEEEEHRTALLAASLVDIPCEVIPPSNEAFTIPNTPLTITPFAPLSERSLAFWIDHREHSLLYLSPEAFSLLSVEERFAIFEKADTLILNTEEPVSLPEECIHIAKPSSVYRLP